jgi:hypothetical protein
MPSPAEHRMDILLAQYVSVFEKLDEMKEYPDLQPTAAALAIGQADEFGMVSWRPRKTELEPSTLEFLHSKLPARFPPLFERFLLTYRWAEIHLDRYTIMANAGPNLEGFFKAISGDAGLWESLIPAGYIRFGKGPDIDYDPVCFDMNSRKKNREMRVVKIDHEEILCNYRIKVVAELASSFEALVLQTIGTAKHTG